MGGQEVRSPAERSVQARVAAFAMHSQHDTRETTAAARTAFRSSFERKVDPNGILEPAERRRRAEAARKSHYAKMTAASLASRRIRAEMADRHSI